MKLIVGLGNPGPQYTRTRHNAGFMVVDRLVARHAPGAVAKGRFAASCVDADVAGTRCVFIKPTTFMNLSGQSVGQAVSFYKVDPDQELLVVVDDLYLPVGSIRLRPGGGDGGHNGLSDIQRALGRDTYPRLRVGVGDKPSGGKPAHIEQKDYVLSRFTSDEESDLDLALSQSVEAVETFVAKGLPMAMNKFNKKESKGT
jgi:PTH1 family peptidyl-tRNA hydrolase